MICVDWGTSSFRAYRLASDGAILGRRSAARGIMAVKDGDFAGTLRAEIGHWLAEGETRVLLSGMIGSRQGWVEAPYLPCPAGPDEIAAALVNVPFEGATDPAGARPDRHGRFRHAGGDARRGDTNRRRAARD